MNPTDSQRPTRLQVKLALAACAAAALLGCDKGSSSSGPSVTTTGASPVAPAAANQPTPAAAAKCPAGMTGGGTQIDPCVAKGAKRFIELTYAGRDDEGASQFTMKNVSDKAIGNASFYTFFYDKDGKQLEKDGQKMLIGRAGGLRNKLGVGQSATVALDPPKSKWPENATSIEAEAVMVAFDDGVWAKNMDLIPTARPKGGVK